MKPIRVACQFVLFTGSMLMMCQVLQAQNPERSTQSVLGYVISIPPEPAAEAQERHRKIAARRAGTPIMVHRGASRFAPENTLQAYAAAMDYGADGVEIDIRRSADGVLYHMHDDKLDRMTACSGKLAGRSYFELLQCQIKNARDKRTRIPTLAAVLVLARQRAMLLHLDVKESGLQDEIEKLIEAADVWDHIVEVNGGNAERLRGHPKVKLLPYKGWLPQGKKEPDWAGIRKFLAQPGKMVFCKDDPGLAIEALGRKAPKAVALPEEIFVRWTAQGQVKTTPTGGRGDLPARVGTARRPPFPPALPGGVTNVEVTSAEFLKAPSTLRSEVGVAKTPPKIDFMFFPGQAYPGNPWSAWGDSLVVNGKYYASIGDHLGPGGNSFVYEYDPSSKALREIVDVRKVLGLPEGHYTPGKIHGRLDLGEDGWIYFSTHRGSTKVTTDQYHYSGDWIMRHHPASGKTEVVVQGPVSKHCIPASVLDPKRLLFYGGTAPGDEQDKSGIQFFAYDVKGRKLIYAGPGGPSRYMIFANSTGRIYWTAEKEDGPLMRFDPAKGRPEEIPGNIGIRTATQEVPPGVVFTVSNGQGDNKASLYAFNTRTESIASLGPAAVGTQHYITSIDADPTGRYLYYVPGAHGGSELDGCPVVQFDVRNRQKKVIAFLHPYFATNYGCTLKGTFSSALDERGEKLFITWNNSRGTKAWDSTALTVIHIPKSERAE